MAQGEASSNEGGWEMENVNKILRWLNYVFGIPLIVFGLGAFVLRRSWIGLLLAVALIIVGPLEDQLNKRLHLPGVSPELTKDFINQLTSVTFIVLLLVVLFISLQ